MKRIILIVLKMLYKIPYIWLYKLKQFQNRNKYPTIDEGYNYVRKVLLEVIRKAKVTLECTGLENLPNENGYLITPNHQGMFDIIALITTHEKTVKCVLKQELKDVIVLKDVIKCLEYFPLDRNNIREGARMIKTVANEIEEGNNYCIFPEGTRSKKQNELNEFKGGCYKIALKTHCPIVPVAMIDCYQVFDNNTTKAVTCKIHYLPAIEYDEYKDLKTTEIANLVQNRIQSYINEQI